MKTSTPFAIASVLILIPSLGMANRVMLGYLPPSQTAPVGSSIEVALGISLLNIGEPPSLSTYDLDVSFDPSLLNLSVVTFGDPVLGDQLDLFGLGSIQSFTPGSGTVNLFELSLDSSSDLDTFQAGDFTLATLTFSMLAPGTSTLDLSINALGDSLGVPIDALIENGSVTITDVTTVPEPGTLTLLFLGIAVMGGSRMRRRRSLKNNIGVDTL